MQTDIFCSSPEQHNNHEEREISSTAAEGNEHLAAHPSPQPFQALYQQHHSHNIMPTRAIGGSCRANWSGSKKVVNVNWINRADMSTKCENRMPAYHAVIYDATHTWALRCRNRLIYCLSQLQTTRLCACVCPCIVYYKFIVCIRVR